MARKSTNHTDDFKKQIVALKQNGRSTVDISREYDIAKSTINKCVKSDLTYVNVSGKWHYICLLINLENREPDLKIWLCFKSMLKMDIY